MPDFASWLTALLPPPPTPITLIIVGMSSGFSATEDISSIATGFTVVFRASVAFVAEMHWKSSSYLYSIFVYFKLIYSSSSSLSIRLLNKFLMFFFGFSDLEST